MAKERKLAGQILDVPPADRSVVDKGNPELAAARMVLFAAWIRDARRIRSHLRVFYDSLYEFLQKDSRFNQEGTALLSAQADQISGKIRRELSPIMSVIDGDIRDSVRRAVWRASRAQLKHLEKIGAVLPTKQEIELVREEALLGLERDFPRGTGRTYSDRLMLIEDQHKAQLTSMTSRKYPENAQSQMIRDTKTGLLFSRNARTPVGGGSMSKKMMRLLVAEETRLSNEVELGILNKSSISVAYWRLSPAHKWYGGSEVCEVMASQEDATLGRQLSRLPGGAPSVSLSGLYRTSDWPSYPHPFCKCFPEAVNL